MVKYILVLLFALPVLAQDSGVELREGYSRVVPCDDVSRTCTLFTVPQGKTFVLLNIMSTDMRLFLMADGEVVVNGRVSNIVNFTYPDRCVTVGSGKTVVIKYGLCDPDNATQVVGYFYNTGCVSRPVADLNNDCKVDLQDFAILTCNWMADGNA